MKTTSKIHGRGHHGKEDTVMPNEVFKTHSNEFSSNITESVDVTLASDDDKQIEVHNKSIP